MKRRPHLRRLVLLSALAVLASSLVWVPQATAAPLHPATVVTFDSPPHALATDLGRDVVYASLPDSDLIVAVDATSGIERARYSIDAPRGMDLSLDGDSLFVASEDNGLVVIDLEVGTTRTLAVPAVTRPVWSVAATGIGEVAVASGERGRTIVVLADVQTGDTTEVVAVSDEVVFGVHERELFVGYERAHLLRIDLDDLASGPTHAPTAQFRFTGMRRLAVTDDGQWLLTDRRFRTDLLVADGRFSDLGGAVALTADGTVASVTYGPEEYSPRNLEFFDLDTLEQRSAEPLGCAIAGTFLLDVVDIVSTRTGLTIADQERLCLVRAAIEAPTCQGLPATVVGTPGDDVIHAPGLGAIIHGLGGNDIIYGTFRDDIICGGAGDDIIRAGEGANDIDAGPGADTLSYSTFGTGGVRIDLRAQEAEHYFDTDSFDGVEHVEGSPQADTIIGDNRPNRLSGLGGDDEIRGGGRNDALFGGPGDDLLIGDRGNDRLHGGEGSDYAGFADARGPMVVDLRAGTAVGRGRDTLDTVEGVIGSRHPDRLLGDGAPNRLIGLQGNDVLNGRGGPDVLVGGVGNDRLLGGGGSDYFRPGEGDDDVIGGRGRRDAIDLQDAPNALMIDLQLGTATGLGDMTLRSIEWVIGSFFDDTILGSRRDDVIHGYGGRDRLVGRAGDDVLIGFRGRDTGSGGPGDDRCHTIESTSSCVPFRRLTEDVDIRQLAPRYPTKVDQYMWFEGGNSTG